MTDAMNDGFKIILAVMLSIILGGVSYAGPSKAIGAEFAFSGLTVNYQTHASGRDFNDFNLGLDFHKVLSGESRTPGVRFSYVRDYIFAEKAKGDFVTRWYAGPGMTAGYVMDKDAGYGAMIGICGNIGVEFGFSEPVCISLSLMPSVATHIRREDGNPDLDLYFNGLLHTLSPRLGIKYSF